MAEINQNQKALAPPGRLFQLRWRINRALARSTVQQRLLKFLPTRLIARHESLRLFDMAAGFVYSQVLLCCIQLDLLALVRDGPRTIEDLAEVTGLPAGRLGRLIESAAALGLLMIQANQVALGQAGAGVLGNPGIVAMIKHHALLYRDLQDPVELLSMTESEGEHTRTAGFWNYSRNGSVPLDGDPADLGLSLEFSYSDLMAQSQTFISGQVLAAVDFSQVRQLLDIGGGTGIFAGAVKSRYPHLRCGVFDLPSVTSAAPPHSSGVGSMSDSGMAESAAAVEFFAGDFFRDQLPNGADLISLVRVLHDHDESAVRALLRKIHHTLAPGGQLLIVEPMAGVHRSVDAYFSCYFLAMGQGRLRSPGEIGLLLEEAGFMAPRSLPAKLPILTQILITQRDSADS